MKKTKFFFVIYFNNQKIKRILNAMRIVADSNQKNIAHITVKGPYINKQVKKLNQDNDLIAGKMIDVLGAGNFFSDNQNTVFLRCKDKEELQQIWRTKEKKTYKSYHPHITIYDGNDREYAENLYEVLNSYNLSFRFKVSKLELYSTLDKFTLFNFQEMIDYDLITKLAGFKVDRLNVHGLTSEERIKVLEGLCVRLKS